MQYKNIPERAQEKFEILVGKTARMKNHPVFSMVNSLENLRIFMQWHVFAVWDFMSLLKRLQNDFTNTSIPWHPAKHGKAARLINDIVLSEETDETPTGEYKSHFELYLMAMKEVGASTEAIEDFIRHIRYGMPVEKALQRVDAPRAIRSFVLCTMQTACHGKTHEVLGSFFFGREDVIPQMFESLLKSRTFAFENAPMLNHYLRRHIELDSGGHGPAAEAIILETLGQREDDWLSMMAAGQVAVEERIRKWDALAQVLEAAQERQRTPVPSLQ